MKKILFVLLLSSFGLQAADSNGFSAEQVAAPAEDVKEDLESTNFECDKCSFIAPDKRHLVMHNNIHDQTSLYACRKCDFTSLILINPNHSSKLGVHPKNTLHACSECDKIFNNKRLLLRHQRVHTKNSGKKACWYPCNRCTFTTIHEKSLTEHKKKHQLKDKEAVVALLALGEDFQ